MQRQDNHCESNYCWNVFIRRWWIFASFNYSIERSLNVFSAGDYVTRIRGGLNRTHLCFSFIGGAHQVSVKLWKVVNSKKDQRNSSRLEIMSSKWTFLKLRGKLGAKHLAIQLNIDAWFWNLITVFFVFFKKKNMMILWIISQAVLK